MSSRLVDDLAACERDTKDDNERIAWIQCADKWQGRALDAENDLGLLRVKVERALVDFERGGDKELLTERLCQIIDT